MKGKKLGFLIWPVLLVLALLLAGAAGGLGAEEEPAAEEILAEAEAGIEALEATAAVKERLRTMARTWLRDGERAGLTGNQLRELVQAMVRVGVNCDPVRERLRLRSVCKLMVQEMKEGGSAEEIANQICTRLAAGETLAQAVRNLTREMTEAKKGQTTTQN
ncbi:MAG: hypothetical protein GX493_08290, partial [Firmicutes bacterium]|nr:hypothetical protein [Bacillota bacterium]